MGFGNNSDSQASTTRAGISQATINIIDEQKQKTLTGKDTAQTVAELNRNVASNKDTSGALTNKFDATKVQNEIDAQTQITQTFGQQAAQAVGNYAASQIKHADQHIKQAQQQSDPARRAEHLQQAQQILDQWGDTGVYRLAAHTLVGGLNGDLAGAAGVAAGTLTSETVKQHLHHSAASPLLISALTTLSATATGALIGSASGHALAGTATAYNEVNNNTLYLWKNRLIAIDQLKNDLVVDLDPKD
jgi:filamentous hemagglutinin